MLLAEVRGEKMSERKFASTGSQTHNHLVMSLTSSPLSYPGMACCLIKIYCYQFNPLPNNKIRVQSSLKACAEDILKVIQMMICVTDWIENIVGKGENAGYQHFLLFPECFQKASCPAMLNAGILR